MRYHEILDRINVISNIERQLQTKVITFYRNRRATNGGLITEDAFDDFESAFNEIGETDPLTIIIDCIGGETFSGWKIASCLKDRASSTHFIIPEQALSAGTLIAISGDRLVMHPNALLSPVDPHYFHQGHLVSALDLLDSPDAVIQRKARRAIDQSEEYIRLLCNGKFDSEEKINRVVRRLLLQDKVHASHSSSIKAGEIRTLGFRVKVETYMDVRALHSLYRRHHFCEHDPNVIIEYTRDPIPEEEKSLKYKLLKTRKIVEY